MAETEGFEPSVGVIPLRRFSKPLVSATHPRLPSAQYGLERGPITGEWAGINTQR